MASRRPTPAPDDDAQTAAFIRRTLCSHQLHAPASSPDHHPPPSIHALLPPLTSANEVDLQLYGALAVIAKEFVFSWYGRLTADAAFADELVRIVAHCARGVEERARRVDWAAVLVDEVPAVLDQHVRGELRP
jgi:PXA domain